MIDVLNIVNGLDRLVWVVPKKTQIRANITLKDSNGGVDNMLIQYRAEYDMPALTFFRNFAEKLEEAPHIRAILSGLELSVGTTSQDYSASVKVRVR